MSKEILQHIPTPDSPSLLAEQRRIAENAQGCIARFFRGHAGGDVLGRLPLNVEAELVVETRGGLAAVEEHRDPDSQLRKPAHEFLLCVLPDQASVTIRLMAAESRFQLAVSASSCLRPAKVSE